MWESARKKGSEHCYNRNTWTKRSIGARPCMCATIDVTTSSLCCCHYTRCYCSDTCTVRCWFFCLVRSYVEAILCLWLMISLVVVDIVVVVRIPTGMYGGVVHYMKGDGSQAQKKHHATRMYYAWRRNIPSIQCTLSSCFPSVLFLETCLYAKFIH